jgi:hypothetical protein
VSFTASHPGPAGVASSLAALGIDLPISVAAAPILRAVIAGPAGTIELG